MLKKQKITKIIIVATLFLIISMCFAFFLLSNDYKDKQTDATDIVLTIEDFKKRVVSSNGDFSFDKYLEVAEEWNANAEEYADKVTISFKQDVIALIDSTTTFTISSYNALQLFADDVNDGKTYEGKTVKLKADIDCGGASLGIGCKGTAFSGVFDGQGYAISNFQCNDKMGDFWDGDSSYTYALFLYVSGTIKNLKISNAGRTISGGSYYKCVGGIVGCASNAVIENCVVENFTISTEDKTAKILVGGIFAVGYATVTDCMVDNFQVNNGYGDVAGIGCVLNYLSTTDGINLNWKAHWPYGEVKVNRCVMRNCVSGNNIVGGTAPDKTQYYSKLSVTNCYTTNENDGFENLGTNLSTGGGTTGWYYYSGYNGGWPKLNRFISWQTISVESAYPEISSSTPSAIYFPTDLTINGGKSGVVSNSSSFTFYGQVVTANVHNCYEFEEWYYSIPDFDITIDGWLIPSATRKSVAIKFVSASNTTEETSNLSFDTEYTIGCGTSIAISYDEYEKEGFKSITLSFTDTEGTKRSVTYMASSGYYIQKSTLQSPEYSSSNYFQVHNHKDMPDLSNISVETAQKSYNATFS